MKSGPSIKANKKTQAIILAGKLGRSDPHLRSLKLGSEQLGDQGVAVVAGGLRSNSVLTELDLRASDVTATSMGPLADALRVNSTLARLNLR